MAARLKPHLKSGAAVGYRKLLKAKPQVVKVHRTHGLLCHIFFIPVKNICVDIVNSCFNLIAKAVVNYIALYAMA